MHPHLDHNKSLKNYKTCNNIVKRTEIDVLLFSDKLTCVRIVNPQPTKSAISVYFKSFTAVNLTFIFLVSARNLTFSFVVVSTANVPKVWPKPKLHSCDFLAGFGGEGNRQGYKMQSFAACHSPFSPFCLRCIHLWTYIYIVSHY